MNDFTDKAYERVAEARQEVKLAMSRLATAEKKLAEERAELEKKLSASRSELGTAKAELEKKRGEYAAALRKLQERLHEDREAVMSNKEAAE